MDRRRHRCATLSYLLSALLFLSALAAGCARGPDEDPTREVARNVRVMPLQTASVTEFLELAGPLLPVRGTDIGSEEAGAVMDILHDKGAMVAEGQPVITLDRRLLAAELQAATANLELQEYSHTQTERLFESGKVSRLELLQSAAQLAQTRSQLDITRTRHDRASIKAPFAGLVAARHVEPGQLVMPGATVARIVDPYVLKLSGSLTEQEVAWVSEGMPAVVAVGGAQQHAAGLEQNEGGSPQAVSGRVAWVGFEAERQTGKFPVEIHIENRGLVHRSGMIARARLTKRTTDAMVVIPRDAILPGERFSFVFIVEDGRARKRQIALGPDQGLMVAVKHGLEAGDLLVVRGQRALRDGGLVTIAERVAFGDGTAQGDPDAIRTSSADTRISAEAGR